MRWNRESADEPLISAINSSETVRFLGPSSPTLLRLSDPPRRLLSCATVDEKRRARLSWKAGEVEFEGCSRRAAAEAVVERKARAERRARRCRRASMMVRVVRPAGSRGREDRS